MCTSMTSMLFHVTQRENTISTYAGALTTGVEIFGWYGQGQDGMGTQG